MIKFKYFLFLGFWISTIYGYDHEYVLKSDSFTNGQYGFQINQVPSIEFDHSCESVRINDYLIENMPHSDEAYLILPNKNKKLIASKRFLNEKNEAYLVTYKIYSYIDCDYACLKDFNFKSGDIIIVRVKNCNYFKLDSKKLICISGCSLNYDLPSLIKEPMVFDHYKSLCGYEFPKVSRNTVIKIGMNKKCLNNYQKIEETLFLYDNEDNEYSANISLTSLRQNIKVEVNVTKNGKYKIPKHVIPYYHKYVYIKDKAVIDLQIDRFLINGKDGYFANTIFKTLRFDIPQKYPTRCRLVAIQPEAFKESFTYTCQNIVRDEHNINTVAANKKIDSVISDQDYTLLNYARCNTSRFVFKMTKRDEVIFFVKNDFKSPLKMQINDQPLVFMRGNDKNIYGFARYLEKFNKDYIAVLLHPDFIRIEDFVFPHSYFKGKLLPEIITLNVYDTDEFSISWPKRVSHSVDNLTCIH